MAGLFPRLFSKKSYLAWDVGDQALLSDESVVERVLNFGDWDDFLKLKETLGISKLKEIFTYLKNKKRTNLRPETINYFDLFFERYA